MPSNVYTIVYYLRYSADKHSRILSRQVDVNPIQTGLFLLPGTGGGGGGGGLRRSYTCNSTTLNYLSWIYMYTTEAWTQLVWRLN